MTLNEGNLEKRFSMVSTSQGSIQSLSFFCLHYKNYHKKIAHIWLRCLQKARVSHRLTLIYLANDIVQNAKRKNTLSFIDAFKSILKDTIPYLRDDKIKKSVERVFSIWQDRAIFDAKYTNELKALLNGSSRPTVEDTPKKNAGEPRIANVEKNSTNDLIESLNKLADLERNEERLKSSHDNIIDRLNNGSFSEEELSDDKTLNDLRDYILHLGTEIDERTRLASLLEQSTQQQRRLLKESEEQLVMYKAQLDSVVKHRDEVSL